MLNNRTTFMERLNDRVTAIETLLQKVGAYRGTIGTSDSIRGEYLHNQERIDLYGGVCLSRHFGKSAV